MNAQVLRAIDGLKLPEEYRALLRPGETEADLYGNAHHLPRFFYEITSWQRMKFGWRPILRSRN
jgi:hypothetical protein